MFIAQGISVLLALHALLAVMAGATLLEQLNYYASQNQYAAQLFQTPFSLDNVLASSSELALQSCQAGFRWQRWNCPSADFYRRLNARSPQRLEREDAYVTAIATAAVLYTIAKNCSSGVVSDCGCSNSAAGGLCSDDPARAEQLYEEHVRPHFGRDLYGAARRHNHQAVTNLLRKAPLQRQCGCSVLAPNGACMEELCRNVLPPFKAIAVDVRRMFDEGLQLDDGVGRENTRVLWANVPLDALAYVQDSPNYCEPDAVPHWFGMQGRQCSRAAGDSVSADESESCASLCDACGLRVQTRNVVIEQTCNCQFTPWTFQVQCDSCVSVEQQYYCF